MGLGIHFTEQRKCNPNDLLSFPAPILMKHMKTVHNKCHGVNLILDGGCLLHRRAPGPGEMYIVYLA